MAIKNTLNKKMIKAMVTVMGPLADVVYLLGEGALSLALKSEKVSNSIKTTMKAKEEILAKLNEEESETTKKESKTLELALKGVTLLIDELIKLEDSLKLKVEGNLDSEDSQEEDETKKVGFFKKVLQNATKFVEDSKSAITDFVENSKTAVTDFANTVSNSVKAHKNSIALSFAKSKAARIEKRCESLDAKFDKYTDKVNAVRNKIEELEQSDLLLERPKKATKKKSFFNFTMPNFRADVA